MRNGVSSVRSDVLKLALAAVVLAAGVEILTAPVLGPLSVLAAACIAVGAAITTAVLIFLVNDAVKSAGISKDLQAVIFLRGDSFEPIGVNRYDFASRAAEYLKGLFAENSAHARAWSAAEKDGARKYVPHGPSGKMIVELYEYYFLNSLSLHLSEVFDSGMEADNSRITRFTREDIPQILLTNRFLETFSKDMSSREAFEGRPGGLGVSDNSSRVVYAYGNNGAIYDLFELVLPKGSRVSRDGFGKLCINTSKFVLSTQSRFVGFHGSTPNDFEKMYLGEDYSNFDNRMVEANVQLDFKMAAILAPGGWEYFDWAESFVEKFEKQFCFESFLRHIGWEQSYTTAKLLSNQRQSARGVEGPMG